MYEIKSETVISFVNDSRIKLPRFQRKKTWKDADKFSLCISLFKSFPMGSVIVENNERGRFLLDGRQRRETLSELIKNPENIYLWARAFAGLRNTDKREEVSKKYWRKIKEYFEKEEDSLISCNEKDNIEDSFDEKENFDSFSDVELFDAKEDKELFDLLDIILILHDGYHLKRVGGFGYSFDFKDLIKNLRYIENKTINSRKLKTWLTNYESWCQDSGDLDMRNKDNFILYVESEYELSSNKEKVYQRINENWEGILKRLEIIDNLNVLCQEAKISLFDVSDMKTSDSQKIFHLINSAGSPLDEIEILSAKPSFNIVIDSNHIDERQQQSVKSLYSNKLHLERGENIVKWDLIATTYSMLDEASFLFKDTFSKSNDTLNSIKQVQFGFKLLSVFYHGSIIKKAFSLLGQNKNIDWEKDYPLLIKDINDMNKILLEHHFFRKLKQWGFSFGKDMPEVIPIVFCVSLLKYWRSKGRPSNKGSIEYNRFLKNALILFDYLVYEYLSKKWDSRISSNVETTVRNFEKRIQNNGNHPFELKTKNEWSTLIDSIFNNRFAYEKTNVSKGASYVFNYYIHILMDRMGPGENIKVEKEHIIPKSAFASSSLPNNNMICDNLFNLTIVPVHENRVKNTKFLKSLEEEDAKFYSKYSGIPLEKFDDFSSVDNYKALKSYRKEEFREALSRRETLFNNK